MIERPPKIDSKDGEVLSAAVSPEIIERVANINTRYLYWSEVKYRASNLGITPGELWLLVKRERQKTDIPVWPVNGSFIHFSLTNSMQKACHDFDMDFGGSWGASKIFPDDKKTQDLYLVSSIMEEAIASSQIEGAATTREAAKEMLRKKISPRDRSQRMILNNYNTINFIRDHKDDKLTPELIMELHGMMTRNTLDIPDAAGRLRTKEENIVVGDGITGEIVHTPPQADCLPEFLTALCRFFNEENPKFFIHPIIRAIIVHFLLAYYHPFADGNGRTARALFYWYMMKSNYWLVQYLSISRVIIKSKKQYEQSYLYAENDGNDIGYFIQYNLDVLKKSFDELRKYIQRKNSENKRSNRLMLLGDISKRQSNILNELITNPDEIIEAKNARAKFGVSYMTIKKDLDDLANKGYLRKIALNGRATAYVKSMEFDNKIKQIKV